MAVLTLLHVFNASLLCVMGMSAGRGARLEAPACMRLLVGGAVMVRTCIVMLRARDIQFFDYSGTVIR